MDRSYISPGVAAKIEQAARRGEATGMALGPRLFIQIWRDTPAGEVTLPAKEVTVTYPNQQASVAAGMAGGAMEVAGVFTGWDPWDVEIEDRGRFANGDKFRITLVEQPAYGVQRARFVIIEGH